MSETPPEANTFLKAWQASVDSPEYTAALGEKLLRWIRDEREEYRHGGVLIHRFPPKAARSAVSPLLLHP